MTDPQSTPPDLSDLRFRSDVGVELVKRSASDADVLFAARVSTAGEQSLAEVGADPQRSAGLINYLMRDRHGCYDERTEVLTRSGWKPWPEVDGTELFLTRAADGRLEYQRAVRVIAKPYDGPMVRVRLRHRDLLVTPGHRMFARPVGSPDDARYDLVPAAGLLETPYQVTDGGGFWESGDAPAPAGVAALLGFFIAAGRLNGDGRAELRAPGGRPERSLRAYAAAAGFPLRPLPGGRFALEADGEFQRLAKACDTPDGAAVPAEALGWRPEDLRQLLSGLIEARGGTDGSGRTVYRAAGPLLAGQIQELCAKTGRSAVVGAARSGGADGRPVTLYPAGEARREVGGAGAGPAGRVSVVHHTGTVHCVTVPNATLYVRRDGEALWCGNSPFEHNSFTFFISAPIFVFREFQRHRVFSYNEESGRYRRLEPVFYVPGPERKLVQQGRPGKYVFVDGTPEQHALVDAATRRACTEAYRAYLEMLEAGIAREVARGVLPVSIYSSMYATCNARALMHFLSLRTKREDSAFPSFPQREIEMVAEQMEAAFAEAMPLTYAAFNRNGRVSP